MTYIHAASCTACEWTEDGDRCDSAAERHTKATGHATVSSMRAEAAS